MSEKKKLGDVPVEDIDAALAWRIFDRPDKKTRPLAAEIEESEDDYLPPSDAPC